jgi:hypothetical protein
MPVLWTSVIARSEATKQSSLHCLLDFFAALAMAMVIPTERKSL